MALQLLSDGFQTDLAAQAAALREGFEVRARELMQQRAGGARVGRIKLQARQIGELSARLAAQETALALARDELAVAAADRHRGQALADLALLPRLRSEAAELRAQVRLREQEQRLTQEVMEGYYAAAKQQQAIAIEAAKVSTPLFIW